MADGSLARRYAKALVELGKQDSDVDRFASDLREMAQILRAVELDAVLQNPGITQSERKAVLTQVLSRTDFHVHVKSFLSLLVDKNRFMLFADILREFEALADELGHRVRSIVTTSAPLDAALQKRIEAALAETMKKTVLVEFKVDPDLIGGLVAQVGGKVFDASVRSRLQDLQNSLLREAAEA
jgi:F-type H+-transporting ATPase subunit delta